VIDGHCYDPGLRLGFPTHNDHKSLYEFARGVSSPDARFSNSPFEWEWEGRLELQQSDRSACLAPAGRFKLRHMLAIVREN
jgi:hypothetical protein